MRLAFHDAMHAEYASRSPDELRVFQRETLASSRRRYSKAARALFMAMDLIYGKAATLEKFRVLEVIARVPYQAWEHVAYVAITHTHETPAFARRIYDRIAEARAQQDNEQWHLLILEELLHGRGFRPTLIRDRLLPQTIAFTYYHLSWLLYVIRPAWSYRLNADFEDHAEHEYMRFVSEQPAFEDESWTSVFADDYGQHASVADLLRQIGFDERVHKLESEERMTGARFD